MLSKYNGGTEQDKHSHSKKGEIRKKKRVTGPKQAQNLARQIPLDVKAQEFGSVQCPLGRQPHSCGSIGQLGPQALGHGLALERLDGDIWVPISKPRRPYLLKPALPSGPMVRMAALSYVNYLWNQSSLFWKDNVLIYRQISYFYFFFF